MHSLRVLIYRYSKVGEKWRNNSFKIAGRNSAMVQTYDQTANSLINDYWTNDYEN